VTSRLPLLLVLVVQRRCELKGEPRPLEAPVRCALYVRVSTLDQHPENQLAEIRRYVQARGWSTPVEYIDHGVSGAKERRPALDRLMA
jgi:hypothetical protein